MAISASRLLIREWKFKTKTNEVPLLSGVHVFPVIFTFRSNRLIKACSGLWAISIRPCKTKFVLGTKKAKQKYILLFPLAVGLFSSLDEVALHKLLSNMFHVAYVYLPFLCQALGSEAQMKKEKKGHLTLLIKLYFNTDK